MEKADLTGLIPSVAAKLEPMVADILSEHAQNIHSVHVVGSAVAPDYNEKFSDINSVIVLNEMSLKFIAFLAPLGKKYGKKRIAAPLVMTPEYIRKSLDVFPVEFLNYKLVHKTVYGSDILADLQILGPHLRLQCEREIKVKLIGLRQGYLSSLGKKKDLAAALVRSLTGSIALFRAIIQLLGKEPPISRIDAIQAFGAATKTETGVFERLLTLKTNAVNPSEQELQALFERYYKALESVDKIINELHAS
jgi:hypothetical protein